MTITIIIGRFIAVFYPDRVLLILRGSTRSVFVTTSKSTFMDFYIHHHSLTGQGWGVRGDRRFFAKLEGKP